MVVLGGVQCGPVFDQPTGQLAVRQQHTGVGEELLDFRLRHVAGKCCTNKKTQSPRRWIAVSFEVRNSRAKMRAAMLRFLGLRQDTGVMPVSHELVDYSSIAQIIPE